MEENEKLKLTCPQCGSAELVVRSDDLDDEGQFIGDPKVGCLKCQALLRVSELMAVVTSDGHTLHVIGERGNDYGKS